MQKFYIFIGVIFKNFENSSKSFRYKKLFVTTRIKNSTELLQNQKFYYLNTI